MFYLEEGDELSLRNLTFCVPVNNTYGVWIVVIKQVAIGYYLLWKAWQEILPDPVWLHQQPSAEPVGYGALVVPYSVWDRGPILLQRIYVHKLIVFPEGEH